MALTITIDARLDDGAGLVLDQVGPLTLIVSELVGPSLRRTLTLQAGVYVTLDAGEITPHFWLLWNVHATETLYAGFGQDNPVVLEAKQAAIWFGSAVPYAAGATGESKLMYWVA